MDNLLKIIELAGTDLLQTDEYLGESEGERFQSRRSNYCRGVCAKRLISGIDA